MPFILTHSACVQPIPRLELQCKIVFEGEIETMVDVETLTTTLEECVVESRVEECEVIVVVEQYEIVAVVEEDTV